MISKPVVRNGHVEVIRWSVGVNPIRQTNRAAPCRKGWWAFFKGLDCIGISGAQLNRIIDPGRKFDWRTASTEEAEAFAAKRDKLTKILFRGHTLLLPTTAHIYCGWLPNGTQTRDGFFNFGEWQFLSVEDALKGVDRAVARARAWAAASGFGLENAIDTADFQIFIPHTVKLRG